MKYLLSSLSKETEMRFAEVCLSREIHIVHQTVPAAAISAKIQNGTGSAFIGQSNFFTERAKALGNSDYSTQRVSLGFIYQLPLF